MESGNMDAAYEVRTLRRTGGRHVEPRAGNLFAWSTALISLSEKGKVKSCFF